MIAEVKSSAEVVNRSDIDRLTAELSTNGIVLLDKVVADEQLKSMQRAFDAKLTGLRWNNYDGYEKTERYRLMVENLLLLDQAFLDVALHPTVKAVLNKYLGENYELVEARGWRSLPTIRDFHGWHGDEWYDQSVTDQIPREAKLAVYLTDVTSGAFNYIRGSHQKSHPRRIRTKDLPPVDDADVAKMVGPAGTAFLFDTSGVHRQGVPLLQTRHALFFNYHDPAVRLQPDDIKFYRYHPLLLNAAFLGDLSQEDQRILGFGNKANFIPAFQRPGELSLTHKMLQLIHDTSLQISDLKMRVLGRLRQRGPKNM